MSSVREGVDGLMKQTSMPVRFVDGCPVYRQAWVVSAKGRDAILATVGEQEAEIERLEMEYNNTHDELVRVKARLTRERDELWKALRECVAAQDNYDEAGPEDTGYALTRRDEAIEAARTLLDKKANDGE